MRFKKGGTRHRGTKECDYTLKPAGEFEKKQRLSSTIKRLQKIGDQVKRWSIFDFLHTQETIMNLFRYVLRILGAERLDDRFILPQPPPKQAPLRAREKTDTRRIKTSKIPPRSIYKHGRSRKK